MKMDDNGRSTSLDKILRQIASSNPPSLKEKMRYEWLRLESFRHYHPDNKCSSIRLAGAGFYYVQRDKGFILKCYCCGFEKLDWTSEDKPMEVHRAAFPNCDFVLKNSDVNIPITHQTRWQADRYSFLERVCSANDDGNISRQCLSNIDQVRHPQFTEKSGANTPSSNSCNAKREILAHQIYVREEDRLASYFNWSAIKQQTPSQLAHAGFFYTGIGDSVRCFSCGVGLRKWEDNDDPWIEHARWSADCVYLRDMKGKEFIDTVQRAQQYYMQEYADSYSAGTTGAGSRCIPRDNSLKFMLSQGAICALEFGYSLKDVHQAFMQIGNNKSVTTTALLEAVMNTCKPVSEGLHEKDKARDNQEVRENTGRISLHNENVSVAVQSVVWMGYDKRVVEEALDMIQCRKGNITAATLLRVVMDMCESISDEESKAHDDRDIASTKIKDAHKKAVLDVNVSVALQSVVEMGYDRKIVEEALDILQCDKGENITAVALLQMVMDIYESISGEENLSDEDGDGQTTKDLSNSFCDEDEKQDLEENWKCHICIDRPLSVVFLPCGHVVSCERCAYSVRTCPVCKSRVKGFERSVTKNRSL